MCVFTENVKGKILVLSQEQIDRKNFYNHSHGVDSMSCDNVYVYDPAAQFDLSLP